jgi:flagellar export protein FliJ
MLKYKFRLEALLKLRKIKEEQCKQEIGRLQVEIKNKEILIEQVQFDIHESYEAQEGLLNKGISGAEIKFFPYVIQNKKSQIDFIRSEILKIQEVVNMKFEELKNLRADTKLMENMKEKDFEKFKKSYNKTMEEKREEQQLIHNHTKKITGT